TEGFEVLVQLVIAAITTEPCCSLQSVPSIVRSTCVRRFGGASTAVATRPPSPSQRPAFAAGAAGLTSAGSASWKLRGRSRNDTRSCGRRGPARLGSTVEKSRASVSEYTGSAAAAE